MNAPLHECPICAAKFRCDGAVTEERSLRDEFAMSAFAGIRLNAVEADEISRLAYVVADAMLAERAK